MSADASCACLSVAYQKTHHDDGTVSDRWLCVACGSAFSRGPRTRTALVMAEVDAERVRGWVEAAVGQLFGRRVEAENPLRDAALEVCRARYETDSWEALKNAIGELAGAVGYTS